MVKEIWLIMWICCWQWSTVADLHCKYFAWQEQWKSCSQVLQVPRVWPYCERLHQGRCLLRLQQGIALFQQTSRLVEFEYDSVLSRKATWPKTARTRARRPATAAQAKIEFNIDNKSRVYIFCSGKGHIAMDCPSSQRDLDRWQVLPLLDLYSCYSQSEEKKWRGQGERNGPGRSIKEPVEEIQTILWLNPGGCCVHCPIWFSCSWRNSKYFWWMLYLFMLPPATKFTVSLQRLQRIRMTGLVHESPVSSLVLPVLMTIIVIVINTAIVIAIIDTFAFTIITAIYQGADETHPVRPWEARSRCKPDPEGSFFKGCLDTKMILNWLLLTSVLCSPRWNMRILASPTTWSCDWYPIWTLSCHVISRPKKFKVSSSFSRWARQTCLWTWMSQCCDCREG